jgi:hypothetical protein
MYKLRAICIAIDVSPQRYERFLATQQELPPRERLDVFRDVKTRWNFTYDMCERAIKLRRYIDEWLKRETEGHSGARSSGDEMAEVDHRDLRRLRLSPSEWHHLELITKLLAQFKRATSSLSESKGPQIPYIWMMYNRLFDYLDTMTTSLDDDSSGQGDEWPTVVKAAAEKGKQKLSKYYGRTDEERGFLFNCATILDPRQKLTAYEVLLSQRFITDIC